MSIVPRGFDEAGGSASSVSSPSVVIPTNAQEADFGIYVAQWNLASVITPPTGWQLLASGNVNNNNFLYVYTKTLLAADAGKSLINTSSIAGASTASVSVFGGTDPSLMVASAVATKPTTSGTVTVPAVTPAVDDCMHVYIASMSVLSAQNTLVALDVPAGGYTEGVDVSTSGPSGTFFRGHAVGYKQLTGGANVSQGPLTANTTNGVTTRDVTLSLVLAPGGPSSSPVTGLTLTRISGLQLRLNWSPLTGALSYDVERDGQLVGTGVNGTSFNDLGLVPGTTHTYRVRGVTR